MLSALLANNSTVLPVRPSLALGRGPEVHDAVAFLWRLTKRSGVPVEYDVTLRRWPSGSYHHRVSSGQWDFIFELGLL